MTVDAKPSTAKEALLAELLGDVLALLQKAESVGIEVRAAAELAQASATALQLESERHREGVDDMLKRTRVEFATLLSTTMDSMVAQLATRQGKALEAAAVKAIASAVDKEAQKQRERLLVRTVGIASLVGAGTALAIGLALIALLH